VEKFLDRMEEMIKDEVSTSKEEARVVILYFAKV